MRVWAAAQGACAGPGAGGRLPVGGIRGRRAEQGAECGSMLPELDSSRRQPEFAMEHSMGRLGAPGGREALRSLRGRTLRASLGGVRAPTPLPGRPLGLLLLFLLRPSPPPRGAL